ncbi:MAG: HAMP domain-containing histidine kinase [Oscillospiraceae bacterium]|jgi:signal transduction histidine kinase|nr:HAMP domain-containing histidine kinase [Oscillospiraceae bacterium]
MFKFINSMRFRVWLLFIGFTIIILGFLYISQIILLPNFYTFIKTQETTGTVRALMRSWGSEHLLDEMRQFSREQDMKIVTKIYENGELVPQFTADSRNMFARGAFTAPENDSLLNDVLESNNGTVTHIITAEGQDALCYAALVGTRNDIHGLIVVYNFLQPLGNTQDVLQSQFFLSACVLFLLAFALSAFVVLNISNPIIKISRDARKLATGDFNVKTRKSDYAEIKTLTENLNKISREIAKTENLRKDLLSNVSHDLKTPLTMIKAYAEMIRDLSGDNPGKRAKHVQVIIDEADRLNGLVIDMLDLSKLQSGVAKKNVTLFNFSMHLCEVLERFSYLSQEHKIRFISEIEKNILIKADITKIEQVLYNLINNAVNHTGNDGKVTIKLIRRKETIARFEVIDTGSGIAKEEQPYIWEKYYKAQKSQFHKRTTVGTGIGLSIVKSVMELHRFSYGVNSAPGKGSMFWFEFPCE